MVHLFGDMAKTSITSESLRFEFQVANSMWYPIPKPILFDLYLFSGIKFVPNVHVGHDISAEHLYENNDAVLLCMGATRPRDLPIANRESTGISNLYIVHHM